MTLERFVSCFCNSALQCLNYKKKKYFIPCSYIYIYFVKVFNIGFLAVNYITIFTRAPVCVRLIIFENLLTYFKIFQNDEIYEH